MPEPYICRLDPAVGAIVQVHLFRNVNNVETVRANVTKGVWNCAVIKPSLIVNPFQVAAAANRAALAERSNTMVTRTVYSEILYNLSLTKNITQSLSKFGVEKDKNMLVCFITTSEIDDSYDIVSQIEGEPCPISDLPHFTDKERVRLMYKVDAAISDLDLLDIVVSKMATKNFVSH